MTQTSPGQRAPFFLLLLLAELLLLGGAAFMAVLTVLEEHGWVPATLAAMVACLLLPGVLAWRVAGALQRRNIHLRGRRLMATLLLGLVHGAILWGTTHVLDHTREDVARTTRDVLKLAVTPVGPAAVAWVDRAMGQEFLPPQVEPPTPVPTPAPLPPPKALPSILPPLAHAPATLGAACPKGTRMMVLPARKGAHLSPGEDGLHPDVGRWQACTLPNGFLHGPSLQWHHNGKPREQGVFDQGLKHGTFARWDANGLLLSKGSYAKDVKDGAWEEWLEDRAQEPGGAIHTREFHEGTYAHGHKDGVWTVWTQRCRIQESGEMCQESRATTGWKQGRRSGPAASWYANGRKNHEGAFVDGVRDGAWTAWYADGSLQFSHSWKHGVPSGVWKRYCPNGQLLLRETFDAQGRRSGEFAAYFANGRKHFLGAFLDGRLQGPWRQWDAQGGVAAAAEYDANVLLSGQPVELVMPSCPMPDKAYLALAIKRPHVTPATTGAAGD